MRYNRLVLKFLILFTFVCVKGDLNKDGRVVLVSPVLAPYRNARAEINETAKDFPVLMLLAGDGDKSVREDKMKDIVQQPVYVKKLEDQKQLRRRRRKISKIYFVQRY